MVLRLAGCDRDDIKVQSKRNYLNSSAFLPSSGIKAAEFSLQFENDLRLVNENASKLLLSTTAIKLKVTCLFRFQYLNSPSLRRRHSKPSV